MSSHNMYKSIFTIIVVIPSYVLYPLAVRLEWWSQRVSSGHYIKNLLVIVIIIMITTMKMWAWQFYSFCVCYHTH